MIELKQTNIVFTEMRWTANGITDVIPFICKKYGAYILVFDDKSFLYGDDTTSITFAVRQPGSTIGYFKCDGLGRITEAEYYEDNPYINKAYKKLIGNYISPKELVKIQFVKNALKINKEGNIRILWFIANFIYLYDNPEVIIKQFRAGYCLHFAMMLKTTFNCGEVCWAAPLGHMVFIYKDIPYDIEGINTSECDYYIPISYLGLGIRDFARIPGEGFNASEEFINEVIEKYERDKYNEKKYY